MTERWRKKLEGIDGASPSDDVFERAKEGPMHSDDPLPGPRMSTRVITIVAAFLVFALAISVFAIPALRMSNTVAGGAGPGLVAVVAEQSCRSAEKLQEDADAGNADWALHPESLAQTFAQEVMGWSDRACGRARRVSSRRTRPARRAIPLQPGCRRQLLPVVAIDRPWGLRVGPLPYPTNSAGPSADGAFKTYSVLPCDPRSATGPILPRVCAGLPTARAGGWSDLGRAAGTGSGDVVGRAGTGRARRFVGVGRFRH